MSQKLKHADVWILTSATLLLILFAIAEILGLFQMSPLLRAFSLLLTSLLFYLGGYLYAKRTKNQTFLRTLFVFFFILYLYLLFSLTLLDPAMGRGENSIYDQVTRKSYTERFVNLIPFRSIYHVYIKGFFNGHVNAYYTLLNLLGNIIAFMPLAFFLPYLFPAQKKWYLFLPTVLFAVIAIEFLQYLFMIGSCDIDDLILNAGGAFLLFLFLKLPCIKRRVSSFTEINSKKPESNV